MGPREPEETYGLRGTPTPPRSETHLWNLSSAHWWSGCRREVSPHNPNIRRSRNLLTSPY